MSHPFALRARFVFPVAGLPIPDGTVTIANGQLAAVGRETAAGAHDLGNVALLPGLVNAHTHLEFSDLAAPLSGGLPFPDWIGAVVRHRQLAAEDPRTAILGGLGQCLSSGTTAVGEIATTDWRDARLPAAMPRAVLFHEAIGPTLPRAQQALAAAEAFLEASGASGRVLPGLSPHAPYTVHPHLLAGLVELGRRHRVPLAMHLAETRDELELLHLGSGPLRDLLEAVGAWDPADSARLSCVVDYLAELSRAPRALVIHGNYLESDEIEFLAEHASTMSVVYCPRTHDFFEHEPYPLAALLESGVAVALGTDSRASNPDLSLLDEMRHVAAHHADVAPAAILRLGTLAGAAALGLDKTLGTLETGKQADLAVVALPDHSPADPHELLFAPTARVVGTYLGGVLVEADA